MKVALGPSGVSISRPEKARAPVATAASSGTSRPGRPRPPGRAPRTPAVEQGPPGDLADRAHAVQMHESPDPVGAEELLLLRVRPLRLQPEEPVVAQGQGGGG